MCKVCKNLSSKPYGNRISIERKILEYYYMGYSNKQIGKLFKRSAEWVRLKRARLLSGDKLDLELFNAYAAEPNLERIAKKYKLSVDQVTYLISYRINKELTEHLIPPKPYEPSTINS